jgi:hypothetical protein
MISSLITHSGELEYDDHPWIAAMDEIALMDEIANRE